MGCVRGARNFEISRHKYNEALTKTRREEMLLNIVRLRYTDVTGRLKVGSIASQNAWLYQATADGAVGKDAANLVNLFGGVTRGEFPTVAYVPTSEEEVRALLNPLDTESLFALTYTGSPAEQIMNIVVRSMNNVPNAIGAGGPMPDYAPESQEFARVVESTRSLSSRNFLEVGRVERMTPVSDAIARDSLSASDFKSAAEDGYVFRPTEDGKSMILNKKEQATVLRFAPEALSSPEYTEIVRIFNLKPGLSEYELDLALEGQLPRDGIPDEGYESIHITIRSPLQVMFYLSKGVEVPESHQKKGLVKNTLDVDGSVFDWQRVLEGRFCVQSSKLRPHNTAVAVKHRGYWFYIDDRDHVSKTTFFELMKIMRLQVRGGGAEALPVLTLPIGGP